MTLEEFLDRHGVQFSQVLKLPSFNEALILLNLQICEKIKLLSDEEIRNNSMIFLSDLRGRLRHEHELLSLPAVEEVKNQNLDEEYVDPMKEAFEQFQQKHPQL